MPEIEINYFAVFIAAVVNMVLGFAWYGPLFGKSWMKLSGMTKEKIEEAKKKGMGKTYILTMVGALVMAFVLAQFVDYTNASNISAGALTGFWAWLGLVAPVQLSNTLYTNKSFKLFSINTGYYLVALLIMGAILASWI